MINGFGKKTILWFAAIVLLPGCAGPTSKPIVPEGQEISLIIDGQVETFGSPEIADILLDETCPIACWMGIVPGQTMLTDAEEMVKSLYGEDSIGLLPPWTDPDGFTWQSPDGIHGGRIVSASDHIHKFEIWFSPGFLKYADLEPLGSPESLYIYPGRSPDYSCLQIDIVYSDLQVIVQLYRDQDDSEFLGVTPSQFVHKISFFSSEYWALEGILHHAKLEWVGYQDYCNVLAEKSKDWQ